MALRLVGNTPHHMNMFILFGGLFLAGLLHVVLLFRAPLGIQTPSLVTARL